MLDAHNKSIEKNRRLFDSGNMNLNEYDIHYLKEHRVSTKLARDGNVDNADNIIQNIQQHKEAVANLPKNIPLKHYIVTKLRDYDGVPVFEEYFLTYTYYTLT